MRSWTTSRSSSRRPNVLDGIYTDPLKWQDLAIYKLKPEDIVGLDVTNAGQATLSMVKEKGQWKPAKGDIALNTMNLRIDLEYALNAARGGMGRRGEAGAGARQAGGDNHLHDRGQEDEHRKGRDARRGLLERKRIGTGRGLPDQQDRITMR